MALRKPGANERDSDLIIWAHAQDWHRRVGHVLSAHLTPSVKRRLRGMDPDRFFTDDLGWLETATADDPLGCCLDQMLADELRRCRVRTFHACRPQDVSTYLLRGLRYLRIQDAIEDLRRIVALHDRLSSLRDERTLCAAMARVGADGRDGHVFLALDDRDIVDSAGHYLIYGSEFLSGVLAQAGGTYFQDALKVEGIPTVLVVDLPIALIGESDLRELARLLLSQWAINTATGRRSAPEQDFSFDLGCDVPPAHIVDHYHPGRIYDPLNRFEVYVSPATSCAACGPQYGNLS